ncbi:hypothetical protein HMPREF1612_01561 [Escherichia coli 908585]|nr:hypothetical protein HMPREF1612_01561 [Escherichia coli 908585]DAK07030.1 MAG TPA: hypothetical protein [Caudoviricetes sp.]
MLWVVNHALMVFWFVTNLSEAVIVIILLFVPLEISLLVFLSDIFFGPFCPRANFFKR